MKTRNILAALLLMVAGMQSAAAQGFRVYKSDGTVAQFSFRTDSIVFYDGIGTDVDFGPFTPVNQCIIGTWYKTKSETITFNEDGTTNYLAGATYEFLPYQGTLIINNAEGKLTKLLRVPKVTKDYIVLSEWGGETFAILTAEQPGQLVTGITVNPTSLNLQLNETTAITATVLPADADNKELEWASSDENVATVDQTGKVTAISLGSCTITATAADGSGVKAECAVTVVQLVTGITLSETSLTLPTGTTQTLTATVQPTNASNKKVTWKSSNKNVATVDQTGKVTAISFGSCTITATAADGSGVKAECAVTVVQLVTGITLSETSLTLPTGTTQTLTATVQPTNASNKKVTWKSSDERVATVDQTGKLTAIAPGSCTITATAADGSGLKAECAVTVVQLVTGITLSETSFTLPTGTTQELTATVLPTNASNKKVTWKSSDESVGTVDQTGKVTAVAKGSCTITVTAADGSGTKATCAVKVVQLVTGITLNETSIMLYAGLTETLTATVEPANANNRAVTWESNDESVATVDQTGKVTAVALGTCTIAATAADGSGVKATCEVIVDHEWVDLGLPSGTLWATYNVGASCPEEYGDYFAWGETEPKENYVWDTNKYSKGSGTGYDYTMTKYCTRSDFGYNGFTDNIIELLPEDDAATTNWGDGWQMPSLAQCKELYNSSYTTTEWTTMNSVNGRMVTSKSNGKCIFLPATGYRDGTSLYQVGSYGDYGSRSLRTDLPCNNHNLHFDSNNIECYTYGWRCTGRTVRPVRKQ